LTIPPTPPPDIDVPAWRESIGRIAAWRPRRVAITHFGASDEVEQQLHDLARRLDEWSERVRSQNRDEFIASVRTEIADRADPSLLETYEQAAPPDQLYAGLERYWRKLESR
jgi:hypothetical protein